MFRHTALAAVATLALAACTATGDPEAGAANSPSPAANAGSATGGATATPTTSPTMDPTATLAADGDDCGAAKVTPFVGREATPAVRAEIVTAVGHDRIRWIGPETAVTMDYRQNRLNVDLKPAAGADNASANTITSARCG